LLNLSSTETSREIPKTLTDPNISRRSFEKRLIGGWFWSLLSIHRYLFQTGNSITSTLQGYMDKRIKRCLANPAILVLALVYLSASSAKPSKAVLPSWAIKAL
jgi:hypothetical protein